jgi:ribosomal protein S17
MVKFYDETFLAQKIGVERRVFHRKIKPRILKDFKDELKALKINNPDIGLDENDVVILGDSRDHSRTINTKLSIQSYI